MRLAGIAECGDRPVGDEPRADDSDAMCQLLRNRWANGRPMSDRSERTRSGPGTDNPGEASDPTASLGEDVETLEQVLTGPSPAPLAVCSPPFGGRERVLEHAADRLGTDLLRLDPGDGADPLLDALGEGPVVVDGCQHLYERRIGGFEPVDAVLQAIEVPAAPVVTGWNEFAWTYLSRVRGVDRTFSARVDVDPTGADELAAMILDRYGEMPTFAPDETAPGILEVRRYGVEWRGHDLSVPVPVPSLAAIRASLTDGDVDPEDVVFERLAAVSDGNVGVATAIWEGSRREDIRPSDVVAGGSDLEFDREEAFCLRILLSKERVERAELARTVDGAGRVLGRLLREGVASAGDGVVRLDPAAVPTAVAESERRGAR